MASSYRSSSSSPVRSGSVRTRRPVFRSGQPSSSSGSYPSRPSGGANMPRNEMGQNEQQQSGQGEAGGPASPAQRGENWDVGDLVGGPSFAPTSVGASAGEPQKSNMDISNDNSFPQQQWGQNQGMGYPHDLNDSSIQTLTLNGILDLMPEGHGYLRPKFVPSDKDVYISSSQIRRFNLRAGDMVEGVGRPPKETERYYGLLRVDQVNGLEAEKALTRPKFDDLTPIYPDKQLTLETGPTPLSTRIIDLVAPIGRGQRGLIVSPPKAGKTWLLKEIANGITTNFPGYHLMVALVGERPEEVTDISRGTKGEVIASNFDQSPIEQVRVAEVTMERAKRLVEQGRDVVVLLDSITRLARAYNLSIPPSGRTLSGGFDPAALFPPKKFLGAARCVEDGGSLTIIGTTLVDTDSRMDDLIYEEFKGTGNMELHLDRRLAEKRIYPAIDVGRSGTRNFEKLVTPERLKQLDTLIKMLHLLNDSERTEVLVDRLMHTKSNEEFLQSMSMGA